LLRVNRQWSINNGKKKLLRRAPEKKILPDRAKNRICYFFIYPSVESEGNVKLFIDLTRRIYYVTPLGGAYLFVALFFLQ
jgi:hypothetical protein